MLHHSSIFKTVLTILIITGIAGYSLYTSRFLIQGPEITLEGINTANNSLVTNNKTVSLKGNVQHSSFISINGRPIFINEKGDFNEQLLLSSGVSIIDIYAKDKFGKEMRKKVDVVYQGQAPLLEYENSVLAASAQLASTTLSLQQDSKLDTEEVLLKTEVSASVSNTDTATSSEQVERSE